MPATLVGWCPDCCLWVEPYTPGEACPAWEPGIAYDHPSQHLHKRRMYVCRLEDHCDGMAYFTAADLAEHQARDD